jgi:hypothetical protein
MRKILAVAAMLLCSFTDYAQWDSDPASTTGTKVIETTAQEQVKVSVSDAANGAIVISLSFDIFGSMAFNITAQRINGDGQLQWGTAGSPKLLYSGGENEYVYLGDCIADGSGGAFISWQNSLDSNFYLQHINSSGDLLWPAAGIMVNADNNREAQSLTLSSDGAAGVVAVWDESSYNEITNLTTYSQIFAQRFNSAGVKQWTANGVQVSTAPGIRGLPVLINDGNGGFVICFADTRNSAQLPGDVFDNLDIYAQRLNANGTFSWAAAGLPVVTAPLNQVPSAGFGQGKSTVSDGAGGTIILFDEYMLDEGNKNKYKVQRFNGSGAVQWTAAGVPFCSADSSRFLIKLVSDGAGGMVAAWNDERTGGTGIGTYAQRVLANGTVNWTANGVKVLSSFGGVFFANIDMTDDGNGNYIFTWDNLNNTIYEILAQKINANGSLQWGVNGKPVSTTPIGSRLYPDITKSNNGSAIITWLDQRNGPFTDADIYAAKITANGSLAGVSVSYISTANGNWNTGSTWIGGIAPPANADVIVRHDVKVTVTASCNSLLVEKPAGKITVNTGVKLSVLQ